MPTPAMTSPDPTADTSDPSAADIPHTVDLHAVLDILRRLHPHLDSEEITLRLLRLVQGEGRLFLAPATPPA